MRERVSERERESSRTSEPSSFGRLVCWVILADEIYDKAVLKSKPTPQRLDCD